MKKHFLNIIKLMCLGLLLVLATTSCDDMLEEKKFDFIQPEDIPDSDAGATQWVMGTYSKLSDDMFRWNIFPTVLDFDCDYITGPDWAFRQFGAGNFQLITETAYMWEKPYSLIHRANYSIENIDKMKNVSDRYRQNVLGELYFLKAYSYFLLVRAFGEVPIRTQTITVSKETNVPRQPVTKVYEHIISLLTDAEKMMYKNTDKEFVEGRASAGAAASLLAKVYATMAAGAMPAGNEVIVKSGTPFTMNGTQKVYTNPQSMTFKKKQVKGYESIDYIAYYKLARDKAKQVIDGEYGAYDLLPYDQLWKRESKNKVEHIWNLQTVSGDPKYGMTFAQGYAGTYNASGQIANGLWYGLRDHWYKLFESKDYRVEKGVMHRWIRDFDAKWSLGSFYPDNEEYRRKATGYYLPDSTFVPPVAPYNDNVTYRCGQDAAFIAYLTKYDDRADKKIERTDATWSFLRFADILLIYAEAAAEANGAPTAEALNALNRVRERSNATPRSLTGTDNIGTLVKFRSSVLEERAMELALEGDRRWDLIRWGIYLDVMNSIGGVDESGIRKSRLDRHLLFPIPNSETDTNKAISENNPGWS